MYRSLTGRWLVCSLAVLAAVLLGSQTSIAADPPADKDVQQLIKKLKDPDASVRGEAAKDLGKLGPASMEALTVLREVASKDADEGVREVAAAAIRKIEQMLEMLDEAERAFRRGVDLWTGRGAPIDHPAAAKSFQISAEKGHPVARAALAVCYQRGAGVKQDTRLAEEYAQQSLAGVRKAAGDNDALGEWLLGILYEHGLGVEKDEKEAVKWFRKAADKGLAAAMDNLGFSYAQGKGVEKDEKEAVKWFRKAADQQLAWKMYDLGMCYAEGRLGVVKDEKEAVKWFRKAADLGSPEAQFALGGRYYNGLGVEKDEKEAVKWYRKAIEQGYEPARETLQHLEKERPRGDPAAVAAYYDQRAQEYYRRAYEYERIAAYQMRPGMSRYRMQLMAARYRRMANECQMRAIQLRSLRR